ncbi:MAG TPA: hypothetical protein VIO33_05165 [Burkholderiaceae bacterium]
MKTHHTTHLAFAAAIGLALLAASDVALGQSTSSTAEQRSTTSATPKAANGAAAKPAKRWDGVNLKPVDERAQAKPTAPDAVRTAPAHPEAATTGTGCHHAKADDA